MEDKQASINKMVSSIHTETLRLDNVRRQLFLKWLKSHSEALKAADQVQIKVTIVGVALNEECLNSINLWLASLPEEVLLSEYHLILNEIFWWQKLDLPSFIRVLNYREKD